jgi:hypothetical protein
MHRKITTLFLAVIVMMFSMAGTTLAQTYYGVVNNSAVSFTISLQVTCPGPPPISYITAPTTVPPMVGMILPISPPPCSVTFVIINGSYYPVGYNGPLNPPNPPVWISVTSTLATIW